jgi:hypothetical protein
MKFALLSFLALLSFATQAQAPDFELFDTQTTAFLTGSIRKEIQAPHLTNAQNILTKRNLRLLADHWENDELEGKEFIVITESYNVKTDAYYISEAYAAAGDETYQTAYWPETDEPGLEDVSLELSATPTSLDSHEQLVEAQIPDIVMNVSMEGVPKMSKKECKKMYLDEYRNAYTLTTHYNVASGQFFHTLEYPPKKVKFKVKNISWAELTGG